MADPSSDARALAAEARWTAIDGRKVSYIENGRRSGPDILFLPLRAGFAAEVSVWAAIVAVGRAVAVDLPDDGELTRSPGAMSSFIGRAIDVFRLRHPHLVVSAGLGDVALAAALRLPGSLESLVLGSGRGLGPGLTDECLPLLTGLTVPALIVETHQSPKGPAGIHDVPGCQVKVFDDEEPWPGCMAAVCAWVAGGYRSVPPAPGRF